MTHSRHHEVLAESSSRGQLQELLDTYLNPALTATVLRRRAQQIQETLATAAGHTETPQANTLADVVTRRDQRQADLQAMGLDQDTLDSIVMYLDDAFTRDLENFLKQ